jgi:hypothetical protein
MKKIRHTNVQKPLDGKINAYAKLSKAMALTPAKKPHHLLPLGAAFLAGMPIADAQIVYSGTQNVNVGIITPVNICFANINNAGANDFSIIRNDINPGSQFVQVDDVPGDFVINGFIGNAFSPYCYPTPMVSSQVVGAAGPWCFGGGQANTLSEVANVLPNEQWTPVAVPPGTTRFVGIRGTISGPKMLIPTIPSWTGPTTTTPIRAYQLAKLRCQSS